MPGVFQLWYPLYRWLVDIRSSLDGHVEETVPCLIAFRTPNRRARNEALCQLCYPAFRSSRSVRSFLRF